MASLRIGVDIGKQGTRPRSDGVMDTRVDRGRVPIWRLIAESCRAAAQAIGVLAPFIVVFAVIARVVMRITGSLARAFAPIPSDAPLPYLSFVALGLMIYAAIIVAVAFVTQRFLLKNERPSVRGLIRFDARWFSYATILVGFIGANLAVSIMLGTLAALVTSSEAYDLIGVYIATIIWPICSLVTAPFVIVALAMIAGDHARWPILRAWHATANKWLRLFTVWTSVTLLLAAVWYVVFVLVHTAFGAVRPSYLQRWLVDIANLMLVVALAATSSVLYRGLVRSRDSEMADVFD